MPTVTRCICWTALSPAHFDRSRQYVRRLRSGRQLRRCAAESGHHDGGTYDKLTENGGNVRGGFFRDISGLSASTQQQAHQLFLPEGCTLNGQKETKIYIIKQYNYIGTGKNLELAVESDTGCDVWAVASTGAVSWHCPPVPKTTPSHTLALRLPRSPSAQTEKRFPPALT